MNTRDISMVAHAPSNTVQDLLKEWGWKTAPEAVQRIAKEAQLAAGTKSGELFVKLGVISRARSEELLASKPKGIQTITWFAQQESAVAPHFEKLLALKNRYPFYDELQILAVHSCMGTPSVMKRADELDAAVMMIEESTPVIIFAAFQSLIKFTTMGRQEKENDPILRELRNQDVRYAIGARDQISAVLSSTQNAGESASDNSGAAVWYANTPDIQSSDEGRTFNRIVDHSIGLGASDISLRPFRSGEFLVQLRRFGRLQTPDSIASRIPSDVARQLTMMLEKRSGANPKSTEVREPADGQLTYRSGAGEAGLRLSFIPLNHPGERRNLKSISVRVFQRAEKSVDINELRLHKEVGDNLEFFVRNNQGFVLVVGPTNSGKSTTVAGAVGMHVQIHGDSKKRMSIEDPIERFLFGISQYQAPAHIPEEQRFELMLKHFKRHDPDMIWVGEIRDSNTADLAVTAAVSGHMALSTLHANDAVMGFDVLARTISPDKRLQLIESLAVIVAQRLVATVCPHCTAMEPPTEKEQAVFGRYLSLKGVKASLPALVPHPAGCKKCNGGLYLGERPINEVLPFSRAAKDAAMAMMAGVNRRGKLEELRTVSLLDHGLELLQAGEIDVASMMEALPI